jgi:hypothetical protein
MRYLNKYKLIKEGIEDNFNLCESLLELIKSQNPIIDDVEDIMLDVQDSWGITVTPWYELSLSNDDGTSDVEIKTRSSFSYFGMSEGDYDDIDYEHEQFILHIRNIIDGVYDKIELNIDYQYPNDSNKFKVLPITDDIEKELSEVKERLKSLNCTMEREDSPKNSSLGEGLLKVRVNVPIKIDIAPGLSKLDGFSDKVISRYNEFVKKYKIDLNGQAELSNLIRDVDKK